MKRLFWLMLIAGIVFNCAGETGNPSQEDTPNTGEESTASTETAAPSTDAVLNPNLASKEDLEALPGLSAELAQQILDQRPFLRMADFQQLVSASLDAEALEALFSICFVPLNLNTASEAECKMVPGVGDKMAHEFEEYRPYKKIEQFRREMGKYVDDTEIARYEKYVFVPVELNTATEAEILALPGVGNKMAHEFEEYRPYTSMEQFRREIGKYVDDKELARLERLVYLETAN